VSRKQGRRFARTRPEHDHYHSKNLKSAKRTWERDQALSVSRGRPSLVYSHTAHTVIEGGEDDRQSTGGTELGKSEGVGNIKRRGKKPG